MKLVFTSVHVEVVAKHSVMCCVEQEIPGFGTGV